MTTQGGGDPRDQMTKMWEAASRSLGEGLRQTQEFWSKAAQGWGEMTGAWISQLNRSGQAMPSESMVVVRELQEASFAVAQAWMRLPMVLAGGAQPRELQEAVTRLAEAQGRAYRLWMDALARAQPRPR
ncbi:MAG: hypothetical protein ACREKS_18720 [Candidatus Rokuibacteriota bacterium]